MSDDKQNFTLLVIVAVVAVVGLIILAMGGVSNTKVNSVAPQMYETVSGEAVFGGDFEYCWNSCTNYGKSGPEDKKAYRCFLDCMGYE